MNPKKAIVASDSNVVGDPRVLRQIRWLVEDGWVVDSVGRGVKPPEVNGSHYRMPHRSYLVRLLANVLLWKSARYAVLVESTVPASIRTGSAEPLYDLAVLNEIELLPWFARVRDKLVRPVPEGWAHLDLHEYAPSQRSGLVHNVLFRRYRAWQTTFVASSVFNSRSVVSPGIASLYAEFFSMSKPKVIRSVPDFVEQSPSPVDPRNISLIHHGNASATRGLEIMIEAMDHIDERFTLHLMLVGSPSVVQDLRRRAEHLGRRVEFHNPVDVRDVARALNSFDLEIIFFPPLTENLRYALPNKLFESVQGRLGIVLGSSPDMADLVRHYGNGVVADGWTSADLARRINKLTINDIELLKAASHRAANELNADSEGMLFLAALHPRDQEPTP